MVNTEKEKYGFKIIVLGDSSVGKTSLVRRFADNKFDIDYLPSIGADFTLKVVEFHKIQAILTIWDIGGQSEFDDIRNFYYYGANASILVFDCTRPETYQNLFKKWIPQFQAALEVPVPSIVLCNKIDLSDQRKITETQCEELKIKMGCPIFQTSAKNGENVHAAFEQIALMCFGKTTSP